MIEINKTYNIDCMQGMKDIPDQFVDCVVTSPPYWGLRDYGVAPTKWPEIKYKIFGFEIVVPAVECCLGLETNPETYVGHIIYIFREIKRVLKKEGTLWLNLGDSYAGSWGSMSRNLKGKAKRAGTNRRPPTAHITGELKPKECCGIPWRVAFALQSDGWYLRQDIIWNKTICMPESVKDRCTCSHEYIFLLTKSRKYYFDNESIKEPLKDSTIIRNQYAWNGNQNRDYVSGEQNHMSNYLRSEKIKNQTHRNKRSVWDIATQSFKEAHFAVMPEALVIPCIKAGCPEGGVVLDPFMGSGTVAKIALKLNRNFIGFELNLKDMKIIEKRIKHLLEQGKLF